VDFFELGAVCFVLAPALSHQVVEFLWAVWWLAQHRLKGRKKSTMQGLAYMTTTEHTWRTDALAVVKMKTGLRLEKAFVENMKTELRLETQGSIRNV
jgi:hypothetical protein